uniref:Uncharacterized protein n=1 Tax=Alexandrium andersonii TaxID=327968 RepID=A0A7S2AIY1_9DINO|mmetsp:Transcript_13254/g.30088  ORF Transcript_13254/g.30088 Transcript_13254/m.30088 type:complete len:213 (+) Transcript_13254:116-754(+)
MAVMRALLLVGLAAPAAAFLAPRSATAGVRLPQPLAVGAAASLAGPTLPRARRLPESSSAAGVSLAAVAVCFGVGLLARQRQARALTALRAQRQAAPARRANMQGITGLLCIRKTFNNTHVNLCDHTGKVIWTTTEKRYGTMFPNSNYAVEAAIYTAEKLGIKKVYVKLKGPNAYGLTGAIAAIRNMGIDVAGAFVMNNMKYAGWRSPGVRR